MRKNQFGFSVVALLAIVVVLGLAGGVGYYVYSKNKPAKTQNNVASSNTNNQPSTQAGTTASIDSLTQQDTQSEAAIDSNYEQSEQSTAASANSAASNVGGSFSETSF